MITGPDHGALMSMPRAPPSPLVVRMATLRCARLPAIAAGARNGRDRIGALRATAIQGRAMAAASL